MSDAVNDRKVEHIRVLREEADTDRYKAYFDDVHLRHRALPELDLEEVDTSISLLGKTLSFPLLISSMTGGDHDLIRQVNQNLAIAAERTGVAMGVGSQRVMFTAPESRRSFEIREFAPSTLLFSNLGAVQLNYGLTTEMCEEAVSVLDADALYLHLNPLQEAVQPEGDTNFSGLSARIGELASQMDTPIILKEVGAGISVEDVETIINRGIRLIDVAGAGGTSWSRVESHRYAQEQDGMTGRLFQDWGIPTPQALQELKPFRDRITLIASGGVRNGIDMAKAMVLGASLSGIARPFLEPALDSADAVVEEVQTLKRQFKTAIFLLGMRSASELIGNEALLRL
jgi:isopentenyl-diphosphate delta-isomerase